MFKCIRFSSNTPGQYVSAIVAFTPWMSRLLACAIPHIILTAGHPFYIAGFDRVMIVSTAFLAHFCLSRSIMISAIQRVLNLSVYFT